MFKWFSNDLAIDLGTARSVVVAQGEGVVLVEPTVIAARKGAGKKGILAVGSEAEAMHGRTPHDVETVQPVVGGRIIDFELTSAYLRHLIKSVQGGWRRPSVAIAVRASLTPVERRALRESAQLAGAREVHLIPQPVAAAFGAELPAFDPGGHMLIDVGAGGTQVSVISAGGIACGQVLDAGGDAMDAAIIQHVKDHYNVAIGVRSAERLKREIGGALMYASHETRELKGLDVTRGVPASCEVKADEVCAALREPLSQIVAAVRTVLVDTPPELAGDIADRGIVLIGGGGQLRGLEIFLRESTDLSVILHERARDAVALGAGRCIEDRPLLLRASIHE